MTWAKAALVSLSPWKMLWGGLQLPSSLLLSPMMRRALLQLSLGRRPTLWQCEVKKCILSLAWLGLLS